MIRAEIAAAGLRPFELVQCASREDAPRFDPRRSAAFLGVSIMFERLCGMAEGLAARGP